MTSNVMPQWFTVDEAAAPLRMHRTSLLREIERGNMTATKLGGRWLMSQSDIDAYVKAGYNRIREKPRPPRAG